MPSIDTTLLFHAALLSGALIAAGAVLYPGLRAGWTSERMLRAVTIATGTFVTVFWAGLVAQHQTAIIDGVRFWWLGDDQMIAMRYARNLVEGNGLVWNPGERVEGFSNPLWVFYMAALHWVLPLPQNYMSLAVLVTNLVLAVATVPFLMKLVAEFGGGAASRLIAGLLYALCVHLIHVAITGWEQTLLVLMSVVATLRTVQEIRTGQPSFATCLLLGLIALVRVDAALVSGTLGIFLLWHAADRAAVFVKLSLAAFLPVCYVAFRVSYYGEWVPNTYHLKIGGWERLSFGLATVLSFAREYAVLLLATAAGWFLASDRRAHSMVLALVLVHAAYTWWSGGDWGPESRRYLLPALVTLFGVGAASLETLAARVSGRRWLAYGVIVAAFIGPVLMLPGKRTFELQRMHERHRDTVIIGHALSRLHPSSVVADFGAGVVFYFAGTRGHDLLGKNDPHIARLEPVVQINKAGHSKFDFDYSIGRIRPDYVVGAFPRSRSLDPQTISTYANGPMPFLGRLYQNEDFAAHCLPHPMPWDTPRIVYRCVWPQGT